MEKPVGSDDPTLLFLAWSDYPTLPAFSRKMATVTWWFLAYWGGTSGLFTAFWTLEDLRPPKCWENTSTHWDQPIQSRIQSLEECKCARILGPTEWWSSRGLWLVTLGVWQHLDGLGDRRLLVSSWSLWEPQEEEVVHGLKPAVSEMEKEYS